MHWTFMIYNVLCSRVDLQEYQDTAIVMSYSHTRRVMTQSHDNATIEQRAAAFADSAATLALEGMVEPAGYDRLRQAVIGGRLSIPAAVATVVRHAAVPKT